MKKTKFRRKNYHPVEESDKTFIQTAITFFGLLKLSTSFVFKLSSLSSVFVKVAILNTIELLEQTWSLLPTKDSQTEGSSAN